MKIKSISMFLVLCFIFSLLTWCNITMVAKENGQLEITPQMLTIIEQSKIDKEEKIDDNIFVFTINDIETLNKKLTSAVGYEQLEKVLDEINSEGFIVSVTGDNCDITFVSGEMSERNDPENCRSHYVKTDRTDILLFESIKINCVFNVNIIIEENGKLKYYTGNYGIGLNEDNSLYSEVTIIDTTATHENFEKITSLYVNTQDLNNRAYYTLPLDSPIAGTVANTPLIRTFTASSSGVVDFTLYSQNNVYPKLEIKKLYNATSTSDINARPIYVSSETYENDTETCRIQVHNGESYAVIVSSENSQGIGASFTLEAHMIEIPFWYPQWMSVSANGTAYWDGTNLDLANSKYSGSQKKLFENYPTSNTQFIMKDACYLVGTALILANKNLSLLSEKHDIRTLTAHTSSEYSTFTTLTASSISPYKPYKIPADPYSVFLANNSLSGKHYTFSSGGNEIYTYSQSITVSANYSTIYSKFKSGGTIHTYNLSGFTGIPETDYNTLYSTIYSALTTHPEGILLSMGNHAIVVRLINGTPKVFDSGRNGNSNITYYNNVSLYTYFVTRQTRDISTVTKYRTFD